MTQPRPYSLSLGLALAALAVLAVLGWRGLRGLEGDALAPGYTPPSTEEEVNP